MTARTRELHRPGFTLVEMLVVIAIIGILAAILVPVAGMVITRSKEAKIAVETKQLSMAIEQYKTEFGVYPLDMSNPYLLQAHVSKLSRNHKHGIVFDPNNPTNPNTWFGAQLPNPNFGAPGQPQFRTPTDMDRAEALVFFLHEINTNSDYPLGYRQPDPANNPSQFVLLNSEHYHFFDLNDTQLRDYDQDGWPEYVQAAGPEIPIVYFDSRTYFRPDFGNNPANGIPNNLDTWNDPAANVLQAWRPAGVKGFPQPYWQQWNLQTGWPAEYVESETFQIICAGMSGDFGQPYQNDTSNPGTRKGFNKAQSTYVLDRGEFDSISSFSDGRLDQDYEQ